MIIRVTIILSAARLYSYVKGLIAKTYLNERNYPI